ncbi:restriction endonuclease subunit S [Methylomonas methanica]|uniref:restriction endonuclease subunit S n=1 Tax=Methylomonas methanica TaxID=421 RepID=UPI0007C8E443|nr:restriction endonuclease subunit S [Methylomonas methanica]
MTDYRPYPQYKPTNLDWLGEIPNQWKTVALHYVGRLKSGESITALQFNEDGEYPVYGGNGFRGNYDRFTHDGDFVLIGRQGALCGNINIAKGKFFASEHAIVVNPEWVFDTNWMGYQLLSMNLNQYSLSAAQPGLSAEVIGRLKIAFPPLDEQQAIARFLDFKTAQIDALIAKKQTLLDKLAEKRMALISHAVTKGLDASVSMKDSGVAWLGEIPSHWTAKKLKYLGKTRYGLGEPPQKLEGGLPFIRATDIYRGEIDGSRVQTVDPDFVPWSRNPALKAKDILVVRSGAYTGDSAIVPECWAGCIAGYDMVFTADAALPEYLAYNLLSKHVLNGQIYLAKNRAAQPHLNSEELGGLVVAIPSEEEQAVIVTYLDKYIRHVAEQIEKVNSVIDRLKEYRSALITNAVTGKIDVREWHE